MSLVKIKLVGCKRYQYKDELFEKGFHYLVEEAKAKVLTGRLDDYQRPYFAVVLEEEVPAVEEKQKVNEQGTVVVKKPRGRPKKVKDDGSPVKMGGDKSTADEDDAKARGPAEDLDEFDSAAEEAKVVEV